ncbi:MAG: hemerythrin domain-containing protein [Gammaproteobacteria bacterium]
MNIYDLLKKDHKSVAKLMDEVAETGDKAAKTRATKFAQIKQQLTAHSEAEDEVFYSVLAEHDKTRDIILEGREEHALVTQLLEELAQMPPDSEDWTAKFKVLKENVEHHVEEEEGEMFKQARSVLDDEQAREIGEQFEEQKQMLV